MNIHKTEYGEKSAEKLSNGLNILWGIRTTKTKMTIFRRFYEKALKRKGIKSVIWNVYLKPNCGR